MLQLISEHHLVALTGLAGGLLLGLAARMGRFCTLGAIEDALYGGSTLRLARGRSLDDRMPARPRCQRFYRRVPPASPELFEDVWGHALLLEHRPARLRFQLVAYRFKVETLEEA